MNRKNIIIFVITGVFFASGCTEENFDHMIAAEDRYFQLYLDKYYPDIPSTDSGLYYVEFQEGEGASPDTGDYVLINYLAYTIPDEIVFDTYTETWARDHNLYNSSVMYGPYKYKHGTEIPGLKMGLSMMKEGGIARILFKSDLGYGIDGYNNIGAYESLMYDIELVDVIGDPAVREQELIDAYVEEHPRAYPVRDPETGVELYYIPGVAGDSAQIKEGDAVEIYYTGQLLDGRVFDSNTGAASGFEVTIGEGDVIRGWDLGLKWFRYGGTGQLLIPHQLAYGEEGSKVSNTDKTSIPPYEALLFDIEVTKKVPEIDEKD